MKKEKIILIGITLIAILLGLKPITPKAATVDYTYKKYRVRYYSLATGDEALTSVTEMGTATQLSTGYGVNMVSARFGTTSKFQAGTTYKVTIDVGFGGLEDEFLYIDNHACFGSSTINSWDADSSKISTCEYVGSTMNNNNRINYVFNITPRANVEGLQFNLYYGVTEEVRAINVRPTSTVTYGEDPTGAINEQTIIIEQEFENISNIINENNQNLINSITEQNTVCEVYDKTNIIEDNKTLVFNNGTITDSNGFGVTDYIKLSSNNQLIPLKRFDGGQYSSLCFYNINKQYISCLRQDQLTVNQEITIPQNTSYVRFTINKQNNEPIYKICKNGNQALIDADHNYTEEDISGTVEDYEEQEQELETITDIDLTDRLTLNWNTGTLSWIWTTFDTIRGAYLKVFAVMTSFLALGVIRLVLNR